MVSQERRLSVGLLMFGLLSYGLLGCSSSSGEDPGSGGTTSSGGTVASGGSGSGGTTSTGGSSSTGGSVASGGSIASGGSQSSGGVQESGGTVGTGGSNSGGSKATGGSSVVRGTGGAGTGGALATGGTSSSVPGTGGAATGGVATGGASTSRGGSTGRGGSSSAGGTTGGGGSTAGGAQGSPGCGSASPLKSSTFTESIDGTSRKWILDVPTGYDGSKPYRLIFVWHPLGGSASQVANGYNGLKALANNSTVFVAPDGLPGSNAEASGNGWWNVNGGDMKLFQVMFDKITAGLCIDQTRIFSTGFSFGGMMSYTIPFEFDVFRAVAPCSGKTGVIPFTEKYTRPIPIMAFHGNQDTFVATSLGKAFFDKFRTRNKCGTQTQPVAPSPCVQYQGCVETSIWCEFSGAHTTWSEEPQAIWKFFSQY